MTEVGQQLDCYTFGHSFLEDHASLHLKLQSNSYGFKHCVVLTERRKGNGVGRLVTSIAPGFCGCQNADRGLRVAPCIDIFESSMKT